MKKLLQYRPALTANRVMLAFVIAITADLVQIPLNYILSFFPQIRLLNFALNGLTMILTIGLLGFNWMLLPCAILEALPFAVSMPSWTAAVTFVVWQRRNESPAQSQPANAATGQNTTTVPASTPRLPQNDVLNLMKKIIRTLFSSQTFGLWILAVTAALIGGMIYFKREGRLWQPIPASSFAASASPEQPFEFTANSNPHHKPTLVVAPIANQTQNKLGVHPERIRSVIEEALATVDGVELVQPPPPQLQQPVSADLIVFVTLLDAADEAATFRGYKIAAKTMETKCSLRVQVIRAADKATVFSTVLEGSQTDVRTAVANAPLSNDRILGAVKDALKTLPGDVKFLTAVHGEPLSVKPESKN